jgi:glycerate 2-kinase
MNAQARTHLDAIFRAGVRAVDPEGAVRRHISVEAGRLRVGECEYDLDSAERIIVVGAGKASAFMARAVEERLGDYITDGWVNVKTGHTCPLEKIHLHEAAHPVPDAAGMEGARRIAELLDKTGKGDIVICCISGGGSALLPLPVEGVSLEQKQQVTGALLACGAPIDEVNTLRKHLSRIKGGQLARLASPAQVITLILSDVIGDPLDVIASGPTAPDESSFADAMNIVEKYDLAAKLPDAVLNHFRLGSVGEAPETPKPGDGIFDCVQNVLVASNKAAVAACVAEARSLGYETEVISTTQEGEARDVAADQARMAQARLAHGGPLCMISGGETTVTLRGDGLGGRNQEFALAAALALDGIADVAMLAAGTDGTDGPTDAAGAFADGETVARAAAMDMTAADYLANNDAYHFFEPLGDLLKTGPTGTNVMDLYLFLVGIPEHNGRTS